jgi:broad specificity phosphatase PhoE
VATIRLVRHGRAAAGFADHPDPGLDDVGRHQATEAAERLAGLGPLDVVSSPLARARQTAAPLAARWGVDVVVDEAVAEIPSFGLSMAERSAWLQEVMAGTWTAAGPEVVAGRDAYVEAVLALERDAVVFTHFVGVNGAIAVATGVDDMLCRQLDNASITTFRTDGGVLHLVEGGAEAATVVR